MLDVHILKHPTQDRSETLDKLLKQLETEPVRVQLVDGVDGCIGEGRYQGFTRGTLPLVSYLDDDDEIVPGIFDKMLECFHREPHIDGLCTRESRNGGQDLMQGQGGHKWKYYDKRHFFRVHHITAYRRDSIRPYLHHIRDCPTSAEHSLVALLLLNNAVLRHLPELGYIWNVHAGSTSRTRMVEWPKSRALYDQLRAMAQAEGFKPHVEDQQLIAHRGAGELIY